MIWFILLCLTISGSNEINALRRQCSNTGILFSDKITRSPIILYGKSLAKRIYLETDTELLFNVTFRVDCIFKGGQFPGRIEITNAGIQDNRTACQWLEPGKSHVVFLDHCVFNQSYFCPMDFQERLVDDITLELLEKTCHLTSVSPLNAKINHCPNVSMTEFCSDNQMEIKIKPKSAAIDDDHMKMKVSFNQFNVTLPTDKFLVNHIADNPHNNVPSFILGSMPILILSLIIVMFI